MNPTLDQILVVSDIDNTLLQADIGMPSCNAAMVRLFCELGGHFTVASGRNLESVLRVTDHIPLSAPAILQGGSLVYDLKSGEIISGHTLDKVSARAALRDVLTEFPDIGVEIMSDNGRIYAVNMNEQLCRHAAQEHISYVVSRLEDVPGGWYKVLFAGSPAEIGAVREFAKTRSYENVYFLLTNSYYYEIMPQGVDKGVALKELAAHLGIPLGQVYAIGDYYNDIELLKASGHAVAVGNAVSEVKMLSEQTVLPCMDGGVAQFLYQLIKTYSK